MMRFLRIALLAGVAAAPAPSARPDRLYAELQTSKGAAKNSFVGQAFQPAADCPVRLSGRSTQQFRHPIPRMCGG